MSNKKYQEHQEIKLKERKSHMFYWLQNKMNHNMIIYYKICLMLNILIKIIGSHTYTTLYTHTTK